MGSKRKKLTLFVFISLIILFATTRLPTLFQKTFPYTYDQGRDFLKVEEIVKYKNPTFIGPTTGIMGLYHGAWWYYYLAIPYVLTDGNPVTFAAWIFITQLLISVAFFFFLKKEFGKIAAFAFLILTTFSPYLINMSSFVINSGFTFPFILLLLYSLYNLFKTAQPKFYFLTFLSIGFIWEAEFAFGIFLLPSLLITLALLKKIKPIITNKTNAFASAAGFLLPFLPRIAFEIKHNFIQTRTLLKFLFKPKFHNPKPLLLAFKERLLLFKGYYLSIFPEQGKELFGIIFAGIIISALYIALKKHKKDLAALLLKATALLLTFLFIFSSFYRDNFWGNYYEGIQFFFIALVALSLKIFYEQKRKLVLKLILSILLLSSLFGALLTYKRITTPFKPQGLYVPEYFIKKLYKENKGKKFCVRIYTPPVIPYTWNYLFKYYGRKLNTPEPINDFVEGKCYFIIEDEAPGYLYQLRIVRWRNKNIPKDSKILRKEYKYGVTIELRKV